MQLPNVFKSKGTVRHGKDGKVRVGREEDNLTYSRSELAQLLIEAARKRHPDRIRFHFGAACKALDLGGRTATFEVASGGIGGAADGATGATSSSSISSGREEAVQYDLLVGADGIGSAVRQQLQAQLPDMRVQVTDSERQYKTYRNLVGDIEPPGAPLALHTPACVQGTCLSPH